MIMEVRDNGITVVNVTSIGEEVLLAVAIISILQNTPTLSKLVGGVMSGEIDLGDLGIDIKSKKMKKGDDPEKVIKRMHEEQPAKDSDIPEFVKRSLEHE